MPSIHELVRSETNRARMRKIKTKSITTSKPIPRAWLQQTENGQEFSRRERPFALPGRGRRQTMAGSPHRRRKLFSEHGGLAGADTRSTPDVSCGRSAALIESLNSFRGMRQDGAGSRRRGAFAQPCRSCWLPCTAPTFRPRAGERPPAISNEITIEMPPDAGPTWNNNKSKSSNWEVRYARSQTDSERQGGLWRC